MARYKASWKMRDAYNRDSVLSAQIEALDFNTAIGDLSSYLEDYKAMTQSEILRYTISQDMDFVDTVDAGANKDAGVTFSLSIAGEPGKKTSVKIQAPVLSIFNGDGSVLLSNPLVTAWYSHLANGTILVSDGEAAGDLLTGSLDQ